MGLEVSLLVTLGRSKAGRDWEGRVQTLMMLSSLP